MKYTKTAENVNKLNRIDTNFSHGDSEVLGSTDYLQVVIVLRPFYFGRKGPLQNVLQHERDHEF